MGQATKRVHIFHDGRIISACVHTPLEAQSFSHWYKNCAVRNFCTNAAVLLNTLLLEIQDKRDLTQSNTIKVYLKVLKEGQRYGVETPRKVHEMACHLIDAHNINVYNGQSYKVYQSLDIARGVHILPWEFN
ncbi:hypothetical protein KSZ_71170 [Dictyobacter formicarum]|uniref:Uncharacterized protein n=1 Tax=Dictyobacter formicarum TaxID=2778368 RepID=A0ABQ3VUX6_9CHLR|nr:hypothetical protein KSZ_71170 [Dictyobacter formicarum]